MHVWKVETVLTYCGKGSYYDRIVEIPTGISVDKKEVRKYDLAYT